MYISMKDIFAWAGENESQRKFIEGDRVLRAGHLLNCGEVGQSDNGEVMIAASCLQTTAIRDKPHEISGKISKDGVISDFKCSCKAGLGGQCKHILATLLKIYGTENLDPLSCTDVTCQWKDKQKKSLLKFEPAPLREHECFDKKRNFQTLELSEDTKKTMSQLMCEKLSYSGICRHSVYVPEDIVPAFTPEDQKSIENIFLMQDHPLMGEVKQHKVVVSPQDCCSQRLLQLQGDCYEICEKTKSFHDEWIEERSIRITGSVCYGLYTYTKNKNPDWDKKLESVFYPKSFKSTYTEYGKSTEEKARQAYIDLTKYNVICPGLVISACNPWLAYSPDGIICNNNIPVGVLEIKCPFAGKKSDITETVISCVGKFLEDTNGVVTLKKKHPYYGQVQLGMAVMNVLEADFVIYSSSDNKVFILRIRRDDLFLKDLLLTLKKLYFEKILHFHCLREKIDTVPDDTM